MDAIAQIILNPVVEPKPQTYHTPFKDFYTRNLEIQKVFTNIVRDVRDILARLDPAFNRTYLMTGYELQEKHTDNVLFEFVCVGCSITLSVKEYDYYIEFFTDQEVVKIIGEFNYDNMLRAVYRNTMRENTEHFLEDVIWVEVNMNDHLSYFNKMLLDSSNPDTLVMVEPANFE